LTDFRLARIGRETWEAKYSFARRWRMQTLVRSALTE
jgi:hypothetical protein